MSGFPLFFFNSEMEFLTNVRCEKLRVPPQIRFRTAETVEGKRLFRPTGSAASFLLSEEKFKIPRGV